MIGAVRNLHVLQCLSYLMIEKQDVPQLETFLRECLAGENKIELKRCHSSLPPLSSLGKDDEFSTLLETRGLFLIKRTRGLQF